MSAESRPVAEPLAVELMNTIRLGSDGAVQDALVDPAGAAEWMTLLADRVCHETGEPLPAQQDSEAAWASLRDLRDALRRLAADVTDDPRPPARPMTRDIAVAILNEAARGRNQLEWPPSDDGPSRRFRADGGPAELLTALIAQQAVELLGGAERHRLRACLAPNCLLFFYREHSRREWCSAVCGNRARVARHYQRHHDGGHAPRESRTR